VEQPGDQSGEQSVKESGDQSFFILHSLSFQFDSIRLVKMSLLNKKQSFPKTSYISEVTKSVLCEANRSTLT
jgi:hypothetical protein